MSPTLYQSAFGPDIQHVNHRVASYKTQLTNLYEEQQMKTDLEVLKPLWSCGHVLPTSLVDLLDAGDRETDDQVDHEEHDVNYEFDSVDDSDEWWVNGGPFRIVLSSPKLFCSVVLYALAYIVYVMY